MAEEITYHGSCQCGAVRYHAKSPPITSVISCNCSRCGRLGSLLAFVPTADFTLEQGAEALTDYQFNTKVIHHLFCRTCGVEAFARGTKPDGSEMVALNVRCLEGVDPGQLTITPVDGKSR